MKLEWTIGAAVVLGSAALASPSVTVRPDIGRVSWWESARAVPVAAYANQARLNQDALMLKGLGRTVLPMRSLFHALGAEVSWDARHQAVIAWKTDGTGVRFVVGRRRAERLITNGGPVAGQPLTVSETFGLDAPAMLIADRVYVPVRAAVEAMDAQVRWVGSVPAIYLDTAGAGTPAAAVSTRPDAASRGSSH